MKNYVVLLGLTIFFLGDVCQLFASDLSKQEVEHSVKLISPKILSEKEQQLLDRTMQKRKSGCQSMHNQFLTTKDEASFAVVTEYLLQHCEVSIPKDEKDSKK